MNSTGIFTWFGFVLPFNDKLKIIKNAGFDKICTWWGNDFDETDGNYLDHPEIADKFSLQIEHAHIPYYQANDIWYDNLSGEALLKRYIIDIKDAGSAGVDTLVIHPFEKDPPDFSDDYYCLERFKRLGDIAGNSGVYLAVENLADNQVLRKIIDYADHPYIGLCFDSGHNNIITPDDYTLLENYSDKIYALHLHDNDAKNDQHLLPYEGNINWDNFMKTIRSTNYKKSFMLEASRKYENIQNTNHDDAETFSPLYTSISEAEIYLQTAQSSCQKAIKQQ